MGINPLESALSDYRNGLIGKYTYIDKLHKYNKMFKHYSHWIKNSDIKSIEIVDDDVIYTTRDSDIKLSFNGVDRQAAPFYIINFGRYEEGSGEFFYSLIDEHAVVLDIGANIGWYSLNIAKRLPSTEVFAFEPIKETYSALVKNIAMNGLHNIRAIEQGVSDYDGQGTFHYFPAGAAIASLRNVIGYSKTQNVSVGLCRIDTFVEKKTLQSVDFIKCDVEGAELFVLRGAQQTIRRFLPIIYVELLEEWSKQFGYHPNDVLCLLESYGYKCFAILERGLYAVDKVEEKEKCEVFYNFLFLHKENHSSIISQHSLGNGLANEPISNFSIVNGMHRLSKLD